LKHKRFNNHIFIRYQLKEYLIVRNERIFLWNIYIMVLKYHINSYCKTIPQYYADEIVIGFYIINCLCFKQYKIKLLIKIDYEIIKVIY